MQLIDEFRKYREACYGKGELPARQLREIEQAFLSGVVQAVTTPYNPHVFEQMLVQARNRLMAIGSFPAEDN